MRYTRAMSGLAGAMWRQGMSDLEHAHGAKGLGHHDWACQAAQQAAEKCLKAVLLAAGRPVRPSHDLNTLFDALIGAGVAEPADKAPLQRKLVLLTRAFGFSRYPSGGSESAPAEVVSEEDATAAIAAAEAVIAALRGLAPELDAS